MTEKEMYNELKSLLPQMEPAYDEFNDTEYASIYLGSYMSLDPCGKYHHIISPNGVTDKCEMFWDNLENAANQLDGWIEGGEGDPTDIYFCISC